MDHHLSFVLSGSVQFCVKSESKPPGANLSASASLNSSKDYSSSNNIIITNNNNNINASRMVVMQLGYLALFGDVGCCLRECENKMMKSAETEMNLGEDKLQDNKQATGSNRTISSSPVPVSSSSGLDFDALGTALEGIGEAEGGKDSSVGSSIRTPTPKRPSLNRGTVGSSRRATNSMSPMASKRNLLQRGNSMQRGNSTREGGLARKSSVRGSFRTGNTSPMASSRNLVSMNSSNFRVMSGGKMMWSSDLIEKENNMIHIRSAGTGVVEDIESGSGGENKGVVIGSGGENDGHGHGTEEKRVVFSNYQLSSHGVTKILNIPKEALANVCTYNSSHTVGLTFTEICTRVKQQSSWCGTQHHLLSQNNTAVATGKNLSIQMSSFIECDRCHLLDCYSEKGERGARGGVDEDEKYIRATTKPTLFPLNSYSHLPRSTQIRAKKHNLSQTSSCRPLGRTCRLYQIAETSEFCC